MRERRITMDGAVNFRDIGGYAAAPGRQTRWHTVYRSDSLADLSSGDLERLAALNLYALADFRLPGEREKHPDRLPDGHAIRLLTPGFIPNGTEDMIRRVAREEIDAKGIRDAVMGHYRLFATEHLGDYASTFGVILQADGAPVLLHCTSGKDRTGFGIALLLLIAGCSDHTIEQDYVLTNDFRRDIGFMFRNSVSSETLAMLTSARAEYIREALSTLRRVHGAPDDWLSNMGFDASDRARLRAILTG